MVVGWPAQEASFHNLANFQTFFLYIFAQMFLKVVLENIRDIKDDPNNLVNVIQPRKIM